MNNQHRTRSNIHPTFQRRTTEMEASQQPRMPSRATVQGVADALAYHSRLDPPGGKCSCGHEVPLGTRFTEHQIRAILESPSGQQMLAEVAEEQVRKADVEGYERGRKTGLGLAAVELDSAGHHWSGAPARALFELASKMRKEMTL